MVEGVGKAERDLQIAAVIKSNLVSDGLSSEQINKIAGEMTKDILDILEAYDALQEPKEPELEEDEEYVD